MHRPADPAVSRCRDESRRALVRFTLSLHYRVRAVPTAPNDSLLALLSLLKGVVEGSRVLTSSHAPCVNNDQLKSLFLQLEHFLFFEHFPYQVEMLQILGNFAFCVELSAVCVFRNDDPQDECRTSFEPLVFILVNQGRELK